MRAAALVVGLIVGSLVLLAGLLLVSVTIWLQTAAGGRWIERALAQKVSERLALTLTVGRVSGNLVRGIRFEEVALHDAQGRLVARADALSARYRLRDLVRRHEIDELAVERPLFVRLPAPADAPAPPHGQQTTFSVRNLKISDGSVRWRGHDVRHLSVSAAIDSEAGAHHLVGEAHLIADERPLDVRARAELDAARVQVSAKLRGASFAAQATVAGPRGALEMTLEAHGGATRLRGAAHFDARGIRGKFDARLAPAQAALLRIHPAAPIRLRVALHGPPRALEVRIDGRLRAARVALAGRLDLGARRGRVRFVARDVRPSEIVPQAPPLAFSGAFTFDGALRANAGLEGAITVSDGSLRVEGASFDRLRGAGRVRLGQPGEAHVDFLTGRLLGRRPRPVAVQTLVRWDRHALRFDDSRAALEQSRAAGDVVYTEIAREPRVTLRAATLSLSPSLVQEALRVRPSSAWSGRAKIVWTPDHYQVAVALGESRLRGSARVKNGELVAAVDELVLQPELVHSVVPELTPARALRIQGAVAGPLRALELNLVATAGPSVALVRARVDVPAGSFRLLAALDDVRPVDLKQTKTTARVMLELSLNGRVVEGGVAGTLTVRHAMGTLAGTQLYRGRLDAHLNGPHFQLDELLMDLPGVTLEAKGGGSWRDFHIGFNVVITDALELKQMPPSVRTLVGLTQLVPGPSVVGAVRRHSGGKIETSHTTIAPGLRWLVLIYDLLRGHLPKFTVH